MKPSLTQEQVLELVPSATDVDTPFTTGAFKQVFPCQIDGSMYVMKFLLANPFYQDRPADVTPEQVENVERENIARVRREVEILEKCTTPFLVKLGPVSLTTCVHEGMSLIFYSEELIEGEPLTTINGRGQLACPDVVKLGLNINEAISSIWKLNKIHRDIKPDNIVRRTSNGDYVLLDLGIAFDRMGESLTSTGVSLGTPGYFSPDQLDVSHKRQLDFRSDFFSLGIVLYLSSTAIAPFPSLGTSIPEILISILSTDPRPPIELRTDIPRALSDIIMRLLSKSPHMRYRSCQQLERALVSVLPEAER